MRQVSENIWVIEKPFKLLGINFGNRSTVVKLRTGELVVHSPVAVTDQDIEDLKKLGPVKFVIAPNNFHHLHLKKFSEKFPDVTYHATQSLQDKRENFRFDTIIEQKTMSEWSNDLQHVCVFGMPLMNEVVFYHRKDKVLILTDMLFNMSGTGTLGKLFLKFNGVYNKCSPSRLFRSLIWNRREFKESVYEILDLDFEKIIMSHGEIVETDAKAIFKTAFQSYLEPRLPS